MAYIDYKVSIWRRVKVKDEVVNDPKALQDLIEMIKDCETIDWEIENMLVNFDDDEELTHTEECLYPKDNNDQFTVELYTDDHKLLSNNQPNE